MKNFLNMIYDLNKFLIIICGILPLSAQATFIWQDGDRQQAVNLNPNLIAELVSTQSEKISKISPVTDSKLKLAISKGSLPKSYSSNFSEVFEEVPGGRKMTLPGDIFVEFDDTWDESYVKNWVAMQNLSIHGKLNSNKNMYRIKSNPGIESLHLANRLLTLPGIKAAFPNWWRESAVR